MSACRIESTREDSYNWATPDFWRKLDKAFIRSNPEANKAGQFDINVTLFMVRSGICTYMRQKIERYRSRGISEDGTETPEGVHIQNIMASTAINPEGNRTYQFIVAYPVIREGQESIAYHSTDLYAWTEPGVLPDYEQVEVIKTIEYKLHNAASQYDLQMINQNYDSN